MPESRMPIHWRGKRIAVINQTQAFIPVPSLALPLRPCEVSSTFHVLRHACLLLLLSMMMALHPVEETIPLEVQDKQRDRQQRQQDEQADILLSADLRPLDGEEPGPGDASHRAHQEERTERERAGA